MKTEQDKRVIEIMTRMYCRVHHQSELCEECRDFLEYARERIDRCPLGEKKVSCRKCPIHCYSPTYRVKAKQIMRYSGPRMLFKHPWLAILHLIKEMS